jgi:nitrite reductase/ring-hydroxylating ferredoxin subunit
MPNSGEQVASLSQLKHGHAQSVVLANGDEILLVRVAEQVFAIQATCTHQETWLDMGRVLPESFEIECPLHDGRFDLRNGQPTNPPVTEPIKTYTVRLDGDAVLVSPDERA